MFDVTTIKPFNANCNVTITDNKLVYTNNNSYDVTITLFEGKLNVGNLYALVNSNLSKEASIYKGNTYYNSLLTTSQKSNSVAINENGIYSIKTSCPSNGSVTIDKLLISTKSGDYTPHKEQVFTFPLGDEKLMLGDYLADDGIHHVRKQVVLNGSNDELWGITRETLEKTIQFRLTDCIYNTNVNVVSFLCNRFIHKKWIDAFYPQKDEEYLSQLTSTDVIISINRNRLSNENIPGFKSWLSNNPLIIEYKLEEEIIVPYTSAQQEVYNQIKQALSYEEQTNISSNQNALFSVEAYQSTKLILQNIDSRLTLVEG